jgi:hypothetical protein
MSFTTVTLQVGERVSPELMRCLLGEGGRIAGDSFV